MLSGVGFLKKKDEEEKRREKSGKPALFDTMKVSNQAPYQEKRDGISRDSIAMGTNGVKALAASKQAASDGVSVVEVCDDSESQLWNHKRGPVAE